VARLDTLNQYVPRGPANGRATNVLCIVAVVLSPVAVGIAVLPFTLYDIELLINRTLVYGSLTVSLALTYLGSVVALQFVSRALTGQKSQLAIVASTQVPLPH
jgi:hypothetical protein